MILFDKVYDKYATSTVAYNFHSKKIERESFSVKVQIAHYYIDDEYMMLSYVSYKKSSFAAYKLNKKIK